VLNGVFLAAGFGAGLDSAIINPMSEEVMRSVRAFKVINNQDRDAADYIAHYSDYTAAEQTKAKTAAGGESAGDLKSLIIDGRREFVADKTIELLETNDPVSIIDGYFIPALDEVGERYEKGTVFLPQLIQSAEAVKCGFEIIKERMPKDSSGIKGKVVLATVKGDIHDIGKNIVRMLLENYGYDVIDLGKDVPPEAVVSAALDSGAKLVGLSALMTTTVKSMKDTITALKEAGCTAKVVVGGAVLNEEYVEFVGADYYGRDARATVKVADEIYQRRE